MNNNLSFITQDRCDMFSRLRGLDLQELLVQIESYDLEYRDSLGLPDDTTFGIEIEYEKVSKFIVDRFIKNNFCNWKSKFDFSIIIGGEIVSPILYDTEDFWNEIKNICQFLEKKNAYTQGNAGGHVHVGAHILGNDQNKWSVFLKLWAIYEHVLFRFSYGDKINGRRYLMNFASPIADLLRREIMHNFDNPHRYFNSLNDVMNALMLTDLDDKFHSVNFKQLAILCIDEMVPKNTIEFRIGNATTHEVIWQNNINTFTKMMLSSSPSILDEDFLDYKLRHEFISIRDIYLYDEIFLKDALEFVDLIFDNNLDKVYFLRQYFKCFDNNYDYLPASKAKKFYR